MNIERLDKCTEIAQRIIISGSIIAAGFWAIYQFPILNWNNLNRKPLMTASLSINQESVNNQLYIKSEVVITNKGNDSMWLEFTTSPLVVSEVKYNLGVPSFSNIKQYDFKSFFNASPKSTKMGSRIEISPNIYNSKELVISPKSSFKLPFLVPIEKSGVYHIVFHAVQRHDSNKNLLESKSFSNTTVLSLQASDYVVVPSNKPNNKIQPTANASAD